MNIGAAIRTITLALSVAAIAAPFANADAVDRGLVAPEATGSQGHVDFWNYDARTGRKTSNVSPGIAPQDLARQFSVQPSATRTLDPAKADKTRVYRAIHAHNAQSVSPELDPLIADAIRADQSSHLLDPLIGDAIRADQSQNVGPDDRSFVRSMPQQPSIQPTSSTDDGFRWTDAGVGAGSVLTLVLLVGAASAFVYRQRRRMTAF